MLWLMNSRTMPPSSKNSQLRISSIPNQNPLNKCRKGYTYGRCKGSKNSCRLETGECSRIHS